MAQYVNPYNDDPCVGNLATPVNTSSFSKGLLSNLPAYRKNLSCILAGLEVGMAHGYFLLGPFYKLGPLRNTDTALLAGFFSTIGLILILTTGLTLYGKVSFPFTSAENEKNSLETEKGWQQFTSGFLIGATGGCAFAYLLLANS